MDGPYSSSIHINVKDEAMPRVQLALNVSDLDQAVAFYSKLFNVEPAKVRPGYANFAITEPPLKLVLIEGGGEPGSVNHLGIEVTSAEEVAAAAAFLASQGMKTDVEDQTTCCWAVQDKVWVDGPDGASWEVYTVLADADTADGIGGDERCCTAESVQLSGSTSSRCC
jgi:catechol 2,3-dioxygenase-like lactoylglutathione lyase family enzyme